VILNGSEGLRASSIHVYFVMQTCARQSLKGFKLSGNKAQLSDDTRPSVGLTHCLLLITAKKENVETHICVDIGEGGWK
jgi:hypothetical protein